ncbi:ribonuclease H2 complex subunit [Schizosaccharomyces cryophilus OY26]|uniref:Ribonuclease H2 subunit B n=1 Tax=Schizosaccharomyces cryophilus (strain OY26 / ATCC MYA-4695 / CBS 11777 / NBRC 106824 / NRRL Y48691) TaxID=653667 RepID=S9X8P5_SCHCR|nr:ribonuclease H2 complex subunit [Schizosaccharomyces cryophilus OY26]EPY53527.1 ribonuclease H2 complex subunit [Schizosaccharomyces cryophilus OY26]
MAGKVFLLPQNSKSQQLVELLHPVTRHALRYLLTSDQLLHILKVGDSNQRRSWFVGDHIVSDGHVYICTPVDLVIFMLPVLQELTWNRRSEPCRFISFDDILDHFNAQGAHYSRVSRVLESKLENTVHRICKVNAAIGSLPRTYQLDKDAVIQMLHRKLRVAEENLPTSIIRELNHQLAPLDLDSPIPGDMFQLACKEHAAYLVFEDFSKDWFNQIASWEKELLSLHIYVEQLAEERRRLKEKEEMLVSRKRPLGVNNDSNAIKSKSTKGNSGTRKSKQFSGEGMAKISSFFQKK